MCFLLYLATLVLLSSGQPPLPADQPDLSNALTSSDIRSRMESALFLLKSKERERFAMECMHASKICTREEIGKFVWQTEDTQKKAEDWFWSTYTCLRKEDEQLCPVDGGWTHWGSWGNCSVSCGRGTMSRHRHCAHPVPQNNGRPCSGSAAQVTDCETHLPCLHQSRMMSNVTENLLTDTLAYLKPFHEEDPFLERACLRDHCSYQQVLGVIQPTDLANRYWSRLNCYKYFEGCPVPGDWSVWREWTPCTSECGTGQTFRHRHCSNPYPKNGGQQCHGSPVEEKDCFQDSCANAIGTFLTPWTPWTSCSEGCGIGIKTSTRRCHGSDTCEIGVGDRTREVRMLTKRAPCMNKLCPELGGWGAWSEWSMCSSVCGAGYRIRVRTCDNPLPVGPGNDCTGDGYEKSACTHDADVCTSVPSNREYGLWSTWSQCSASCGGGVRLRHRSCVDHQTVECTGPVYNIWPCNIKQPCPVDGFWSEWSSWTPCSVTCGTGKSDRYRLCANSSPAHGGRLCNGSGSETKPCREFRCPPMTPQWGSWGEWTDCSASCEGGRKSRQRWCLVRQPGLGRLVRVRMNNRCAGEYQQLGVCNAHTCPVDGSWASWSEWSTCTVGCGEGVMSRDRSCTDPAPVRPGDVCGGYGTETRHCFRRPCAKLASLLLVFDGSSFLVYRRAAHPARHLLLFLVFLPSDPHGLLVLRREEEYTDFLIMVRLVEARVELYGVLGENIEVQFEGDEVKLNKWNTLEVGIAGQEAWLRVNDGDITLYTIDQPISDGINWDLPMYVGGALPNMFPEHFQAVGGFTGKLADLRVNYREYSLHETDQWEGGGLPYINFNVEEEVVTDIDSKVPRFTGEEYAALPCPLASNASKVTPFFVSLTLRPEDGEGVLLFVPGEFLGSFFMLSLEESNLLMTLSLGRDQEIVQRIGPLIEFGTWSLMDVRVEGFDAVLRIDKGPATQLTSVGHAPFRAAPVVYVGGVSLWDRAKVKANAGVSHGYRGEILEATINWVDFKLYEAALTTDILVNSASATVGAHFRDVHAPVGSSVLLRCQYGHLVDEIDSAHRWVHAQWLYNGDRLLEFNPHRKIIPSDPSHPYSASLLLSSIPKSAEGFYACQVTFRGSSVITHAFSLSVKEVDDDVPVFDRLVDIIIVASVVAVLVVAGVIVLLSYCPSCRRRSYFLDVLHDSLIHCCGCTPAEKLPPGLTYTELYSVDATYGKQFSARAEKAQLDARMRRQHYNQRLITEEDDGDEEEEEGGIEMEEKEEEQQYQQYGTRGSQKQQGPPNRDTRGNLLSSIRERQPMRKNGQTISNRRSPEAYARNEPGSRRMTDRNRSPSLELERQHERDSTRSQQKSVPSVQGFIKDSADLSKYESPRIQKRPADRGGGQVDDSRTWRPTSQSQDGGRVDKNLSYEKKQESTASPTRIPASSQDRVSAVSEDEPWFMTSNKESSDPRKDKDGASRQIPTSAPIPPPPSLQPPPPPPLTSTVQQVPPSPPPPTALESVHQITASPPPPPPLLTQQFVPPPQPPVSQQPFPPPAPPTLPTQHVVPPPMSSVPLVPAQPAPLISQIGPPPQPPSVPLQSFAPPPPTVSEQSLAPPVPPMPPQTLAPPPPPPLNIDALPPFAPQGEPEKTSANPHGISVGDLSRTKIELNRQRRENTGARFGSGPAVWANTNQNAAEERSRGEEEIAPYYVTHNAQFRDPNCRSDRWTLPDGDTNHLRNKEQRLTKSAHDQDEDCCTMTADRFSDLLDSATQVKCESPTSKYGSTVKGNRDVELEVDDTLTCTDCRENLDITGHSLVLGSHSRASSPANKNQNGAGDDVSCPEETTAYVPMQDEVFSDPNSGLHIRSISDRNFNRFGQQRNTRTILDHEDDRFTLSLVSELMESMEPVAYAPTPTNCKAQKTVEENLLIKLDDEFLCSDCQENPKTTEDVVSNDDDFESCADNSP